MNKIDKAVETQLRNLQARCGKSLEELFAIIRKSGLSRHGEIRDMLKRDLEMGHGDANTLVHVFRAQQEGAGNPDSADPLDSIYAGIRDPPACHRQWRGDHKLRSVWRVLAGKSRMSWCSAALLGIILRLSRASFCSILFSILPFRF